MKCKGGSFEPPLIMKRFCELTKKQDDFLEIILKLYLTKCANSGIIIERV